MKGVHCSWVDMQKIRQALANGEHGDQARLEHMRCVDHSTVSAWKAVCDLLDAVDDKRLISNLSTFQPSHAYELARVLRRQHGRDVGQWPEEAREQLAEWIDRVETEQLTVKELRLAVRQARQEEASEQAAEMARTVTPGLAADVLLADPPWEYDFAETNNRALEIYPTASPEQIIGHLSEPWFPPLADDCILFLWATAPKLREALAVLEGWGFFYKTHAVWDKEQVGMGYWFRGRHELLLVGARGVVSPPDPDRRFPSVFREQRSQEHSRKPVCVYEAIESMFPDKVLAEAYCRGEPRPRWLGAGNESSARLP
jgi:N6-adenosine-specific RNA methylase IME4